MSQRQVTSTFPESRKYENRFVAAPAEPGYSHHGGAERADVSAREAEIDQLVYSLYSLTRDEIAIIEESLREKTIGREVTDETELEK